MPGAYYLKFKDFFYNLNNIYMKQTLIFGRTPYVIFVLLLNFCTACNKQTATVVNKNLSKNILVNQSLTVDFSINKGTGYPGVFGEQGAPDDAATATKMAGQGFTTVRTGCDVNWLLGDPSTITLADYKNDVNGIRTDPSKVWLSNSNELANYGSKGIKFIATIGYVPTWLSYNPNSVNGVPKDWTVFEELVQKMFLKYKSFNCVGYIEIWNEPTGQFLDLTGSPYTDRLTAYKDIYYHTAKAIRAVDANIPLGGPTAGDSKAWCIAWADSLLSDNRISKDVNFLNYHLYDHSAGNDSADIANWKAVAAKHGIMDMPIFITEWNYSWDLGIIPINNESTDAISFVGKRLTDFYTNHLFAANIFAMFQYSSTNQWRQDMCGIYENGNFMPKVRTFYLMSKILSLGNGLSVLKKTSWSAGQNITNAACAVTADNKKVVWVTNDTTNSTNLSIIVKGLSLSTQYTASVWEASATNTTQSVRQSIIFSTDQTGTGHFTLSIVGKSVTGFIIQ